jgi:vacuolar iron transporter family protein
MPEKQDQERYLANLQKETDGAYVYGILAKVEKQPQLAEIYRRMAASEERHAAAWRARLEELGVKTSAGKAGWRARLPGFLTRRFGPALVFPTITGNEQADSHA